MASTEPQETSEGLVFTRVEAPSQPAATDAAASIRRPPRQRTETSSRPPVSGPRRTSMNIKGMRRTSSLRDGAPAYPHDDIPDDILYRHCSDQVPPVVRMKHLLCWTLHRSLAQALGESPMPRLSRRRHGKSRAVEDGGLSLLHEVPKEAAHTLSEHEKQQIAEVSPLLRKVIDETMRDLNDGLIGISWLRHAKSKESHPLQPHPRNQSNRQAVKQLSGMLHQLDTELASWKEYEDMMQRLHAEADQMEAQAAHIREQATERRKGRASASNVSSDTEADEEQVIAEEVERGLSGSREATLPWTLDDADEHTRRQLDLVQTIVSATDELNQAVLADDHASHSTRTDLAGTEVDPRLDTLELSVDKLHQRLHVLYQMERLAHDYIQRISHRAAHALQERTSASLASFSGTSLDTEGTDPAMSAQAQKRLDTLLAGIHDPIQERISTQAPTIDTP
ncbi:kinetochore protein mis13 [Malassezia pachydermatis]|uniref:Kinetochore protein mis13 n=1 Tax=Malassezia pachydermatis TaxID=77020 RepID=A0A0N0RSP7_9BASI|nr:kinetochore protein mis13 [Malassezia pachydermatis]KOS16179.1 kinetochore protein mis13 [Malassezia pachydermatis]